MPSLFDTLNLGSRSLLAQQQAMEVTGHNIANVNNPAYTRQRAILQSSSTLDAAYGPLGTGVDIVGVQRLRNELTDQQIQSESSVRGFLEAQQKALQNAQTSLGQTVSSGNTTDGNINLNGLASSLSDFLNGFQAVSADPASISARQNVIGKAAALATKFNITDQRLASLQSQLNQSVQSDTDSANQILSEIAELNKRIATSSATAPSAANDLMDTRQEKIEALSKLVNIEVGQNANGMVDISIAGNSLVSGIQVVDSLATRDAGGGQLLLQTQNGGAPLSLTGGSIAGTIEARDGEVTTLRANLNSLASTIISQVNNVHAGGFGLNGTSGIQFFLGSDASNIQVNSALVDDPSLLQASGSPDAGADNTVALALAQLANNPDPALNNLTFAQHYSQTVTALGLSLNSVNNRLSDQDTVDSMLAQQRDSESGVSLDEEMTNMVKFQRAFQASAQIISTVDEMLNTVIQMKA